MRTTSRRTAGHLLAIAVSLVMAGAPAIAGDLHFVGHLQGSQEVPPVDTLASGLAQVTVNGERTAIHFVLDVAGIDPAAITMAHIHAGIPGVNGPVIFTLSPGSFTSPLAGTLADADLEPHPEVGVSTFADAISKMRDGAAYVNVHSTANPGGEVRGQLGLIAGIKVRKSINPRSNGVIAVRILTTPDFDARSIDPDTVRFGPGLAPAAHPKNGANADEGGPDDLLMHFRTRASGIQCGDEFVDLYGFTSLGLRIEARAPIRTVGCKGNNGHGHGHGHGHGNGHGHNH